RVAVKVGVDLPDQIPAGGGEAPSADSECCRDGSHDLRGRFDLHTYAGLRAEAEPMRRVPAPPRGVEPHHRSSGSGNLEAGGGVIDHNHRSSGHHLVVAGPADPGPVILRFDKAARPGMTVAQHFPLAPREQVEGWDVVAEGRPGFSPGAVPVKHNRHDRLRFAFPRSVSREPAVEGGAADFCYGSVGIPGSRALRWMRTGDKKQVNRVQTVPAGIGAVAGERGVVCIALAASVLAIYDSPGTGAAEIVAVGRHEHAGTGTTQGAIGKLIGPTGEGRAEIELASLRFVQRIPDGLKVSAVVGLRHERIDGHDNTP